MEAILVDLGGTLVAEAIVVDVVERPFLKNEEILPN